MASPSNDSNSAGSEDKDKEDNETKSNDNDSIGSPPEVPSVRTGADSDNSGSSDSDVDSELSYSDYDDDGQPPNLNRPKTPAHTLRSLEAEQWTHDELDEMQTGMMQELSRLLSTANLNDPMLDQLNIAVMTPRVHPSASHHKTSTMDSIFSFMSNDSDYKDDRSLQFFAMDPQDNAKGQINEVPSKMGGNNSNNPNNNNNINNNNNKAAPVKGTNDYQNKAKMAVDKTIESISSSVDEVISKLEKDKTAFGKKTKDKNGLSLSVVFVFVFVFVSLFVCCC